MRSLWALSVLVLACTVDQASAGRCRPTNRTTLTGSTTTTVVSTGTTTGVDPTSTETQGPRVIKNEVANGNFASRDPDGGVPAFTVDGEARVVSGQGYKGDGSKDSGCVELSASDENTGNPQRRDLGPRDLGPFVGISQNIFNLDITTLYTIRFFYAVVTTSALNVCWIDAYLGTNNFFSAFIFSTGPSIQWATVLQQTNVASASAPIGISVTCISGGISMVYIDSIFMSNLVTPQNINDVALDYGDGDDTSTSSLNGGTTSLMSTTISTASRLFTDSEELQSTSTILPNSFSLDSTTSQQPDATSTAEVSESIISVPSNGTTTARNSNDSTFTTAPESSSLYITTSAPYNGTTISADSVSSTLPTVSDSISFVDTATSVPSNGAMTSTGTTSVGSVDSAVPTATGTGGSRGPRPISTAPVSKVCAALLGTPSIAGRACAMRPYNSAGGYSRFPSGDVSKEQCAALCLADSNCQSFEWTYQGSGCANDCRLIASTLSNAQGNFGPAIWAYDRSCIIETECTGDPSGSVCINAIGSTPDDGCSQRVGTLKACAKPFVTASVSLICGATNQCRDICAQYPSCRSFSTSYSGSNNCFLYEGTVAEVADTGGSTFFSDISCYDCGENMGYSKYAFFLDDPALMPDMTCEAPPSSSSTTTHASTTTIISTQAPSTTELPSSISATQTSSVGTRTCPAGASPPGYCSAISPVPATQAPLPGVDNSWLESDDGTPPDAPTACWVFGVKKQGWWGRTRGSNQRQNSIEDCAFLCSQEVNCKAFALDVFDDLSGPTCALSSEKLGVDGVDLNVEWSLMWNDLDCFRCDSCDIIGAPLTETTAPSSSLSPSFSVPLNTTVSTWTSTAASSSQTPQETSQSSYSSNEIVTTSATETEAVTTTATTSSQFCSATVNQFKPMANSTVYTPPVCTSKQDSSSDYLCGHTGYFPWAFDQASFDDFPYQTSEQQCAAICSVDPYCIASGWSESYGRCAIGYHELEWITWQQFGTDLITWSDMGCWDCPECLNIPQSTPSSTSSTSTTSTFDTDQTIVP